MSQRTSHVLLLIISIAAITWLGGINIRAMIGFDLLETGTIDFKPNIHPYVERAVYALVAQSSIIVDVAYIVVWIAGIVWLRATHLKLRQEGWLMMSALLFYLFTPVEIYTMVLDVRMWILDHLGSNDLVEFRKLFIHRLGALAGVPLIALLCYYTIIPLVIFKPMRKPQSASEGQPR